MKKKIFYPKKTTCFPKTKVNYPGILRGKNLDRMHQAVTTSYPWPASAPIKRLCTRLVASIQFGHEWAMFRFVISFSFFVVFFGRNATEWILPNRDSLDNFPRNSSFRNEAKRTARRKRKFLFNSEERLLKKRVTWFLEVQRKCENVSREFRCAVFGSGSVTEELVKLLTKTTGWLNSIKVLQKLWERKKNSRRRFWCLEWFEKLAF